MEHDPARVLGEVAQQQPLRPGQVHELAVAADQAPPEVDLDVVEAQDHRGTGPVHRAAQDGPYAGGQLVGLERLREGVVRAEVEAPGLVGWSRACSAGSRGSGGDHAHQAHDLDPVEVRHRSPRITMSGRAPRRWPAPTRRCLRGDDAEPLRQRHVDETCDRRLVSATRTSGGVLMESAPSPPSVPLRRVTPRATRRQRRLSWTRRALHARLDQNAPPHPNRNPRNRRATAAHGLRFTPFPG